MMTTITELLREYARLGIREQIDYDRFYLYSIITHSTAIEGSTVTEMENRLLFDEDISTGRPMVEQLMNVNLKAAYKEAFALATAHTEFTTDMLCWLSALVMKDTGAEYSAMAGNFSSAKGELRRLNVSAGFGGRSYLSYQKVPAAVEAFCQWLNAERIQLPLNDVEAVYDLSFEAHYRLVSIHPWADGNGRMSRLVMNMVQQEMGVVPSIVKKECRKQYIESLEQSQLADDATPFKQFMYAHHCQNIRQQIEEYLRSTGEGQQYDTQFTRQ